MGVFSRYYFFLYIISKYARSKNFSTRALFYSNSCSRVSLSRINYEIQKVRYRRFSILIVKNTAKMPLFTFANRWLQLSWPVITFFITELSISPCQLHFCVVVKCFTCIIKVIIYDKHKPIRTTISSIFFCTLVQFTKHDNYLLFERTT